MTSFFEKAFVVLTHQPETICAVLGTSSPIMNSSAVPVILSTDETYDSLCSELETEEKFLSFFSTFSDTMQFTEKLRIQNRDDGDFVKGILENLINNKRYFSRTIRLLELPSADSLIEACSLDSSPTTPLVLSNLQSLTIQGCFEGFFLKGTLQDEQLKPICSLCPFLENLSIPRQLYLTDEGVKFLSSLKHLQSLNLFYCYKITDDGLQHLAKLSSLLTLDLSGCCNITDSGLEHLAKLSCLRTLTLVECSKITETGCRVFSESTKVILVEVRD